MKKLVFFILSFLLTLSNHGIQAMDIPAKALFDAVHSTNLKKAKQAIEDGANVNYKNSIDGNTPLHIAALHQNHALIGLLIEKDADVNATNNLGETPLHSLLIYKIDTPGLIPILVYSGSDVNAQNNAGDTALDYLRSLDHEPTKTAARILLEFGAQSDLFFQWARDKLQRLKEHTDSCNQEKDIPYLSSILEYEKVKPSEDAGQTLLKAMIFRATCHNHYAQRYNQTKKAFDQIKKLVDEDSTFDTADDKGLTALHYAARDNINILKLFLVKKLHNINVRDKEGLTPLDRAIFLCCGLNRLKLLLESGAKSDKFSLALAMVKLHNQLNIAAEVCNGRNGEYQRIITKGVNRFKLLLQHNCSSINEVQKDGTTLLMNAAYFYQHELIDLLIKAGADTSIADKKGMTALDYVKSRSAPDIGSYSNLVMSGYLTKDRHNKCIDLLTKNPFKRVWYKRWTSLPPVKLSRLIFGDLPSSP